MRIIQAYSGAAFTVEFKHPTSPGALLGPEGMSTQIVKALGGDGKSKYIPTLGDWWREGHVVLVFREEDRAEVVERFRSIGIEVPSIIPAKYMRPGMVRSTALVEAVKAHRYMQRYARRHMPKVKAKLERPPTTRQERNTRLAMGVASSVAKGLAHAFGGSIECEVEVNGRVTTITSEDDSGPWPRDLNEDD